MADMEWASKDDLKAGDTVIADGGFDCIGNGEEREVKANDAGNLYVDCSEGCHFLDGQIMDGKYIGLCKKEQS